ncbi:MAG: electron transport complex subunit RsxG [Oceanicoccus sp.]
MLGEAIARNAILLGLFAVVSTAIIAGTFLGSEEKIRQNIRIAEEQALLEIIPRSRHNNSMLDDAYTVDDQSLLGLRSEKNYYIARKNDVPVAVIFPATARDGYSGDIDMIIGVNVNGSVAGVRILSHRETPGLGDAIDRKKSDWIDNFVGKSLVNPAINLWKVKKDKGIFDQFTGATITPRAVTKTIFQSLQYFDKHQHQLLNQQPHFPDGAVSASEVTSHD